MFDIFDVSVRSVISIVNGQSLLTVMLTMVFESRAVLIILISVGFSVGNICVQRPLVEIGRVANNTLKLT